MRVHIIETDSQFSGVMARFLEKNSYIVTRSGLSAINAAMDTDALVYELDAQADPVLQHLEALIDAHPEIPVIVTTDTDNIKIGVGVIKAGAADCLVKPFLPDQLKQALETATARKKKQVDEHEKQIIQHKASLVEDAPEENVFSKDFLWTPGMEILRKQTEMAIRKNAIALIVGEEGVGKEQLAKYVHEQSSQRNGPFVAAEGPAMNMENCNEWLTTAASGTLFIDVSEGLPSAIWPELLKHSRNDIRLILSSTQDFETLVQQGKMPVTLFDGVEYISMNLAPLRKRSADILALAHHFSAEACAELKKERMFFSPEAERAFLEYEWPGNVRELRNVVNRMVLLGNGGEAWRTAYFNFRNTGEGQMEPEKVPATKNTINLREASAKAEMDFILRMLEKVKFNKSAAARLMNISRRTLYNKLRMS